MSEFYEEMAELAQELLDEFNQFDTLEAKIVRTARVASDSDKPFDLEDDTPAEQVIVGVAGPVQQKYIDGTTITSRMVQVIVPALNLAFEPQLTDKIVVDARERKPVRRKRIPEAGVPIVYIFFVAD